MGFVFVAFWMLACVDLLCFGSLLGSIFRVLGACWVDVWCFGSLLGSIFNVLGPCRAHFWA